MKYHQGITLLGMLGLVFATTVANAQNASYTALVPASCATAISQAGLNSGTNQPLWTIGCDTDAEGNRSIWRFMNGVWTRMRGRGIAIAADGCGGGSFDAYLIAYRTGTQKTHTQVWRIRQGATASDPWEMNGGGAAPWQGAVSLCGSSVWKVGSDVAQSSSEDATARIMYKWQSLTWVSTGHLAYKISRYINYTWYIYDDGTIRTWVDGDPGLVFQPGCAVSVEWGGSPRGRPLAVGCNSTKVHEFFYDPFPNGSWWQIAVYPSTPVNGHFVQASGNYALDNNNIIYKAP